MKEELRKRILKTLDWMIKTMIWKHDQSELQKEEYSPELKEAIELQRELKDAKGTESQDG